MRAAYSVALVSLLTVVSPANAEVPRFRLDIKPRAPQPSYTTTMHCSENAICQDKVDLVIDEKRQPVTVSALFVPGNVYVRFGVANEPLFVGGQPYFHVPLGTTRRASGSLAVNEPTPQALADSENRLVVRPVLRGPAAHLAIIDIDIRPDD